MDKLLKTHCFSLNESNSGESLVITTKFFANDNDITDEDGIYTNQEITLQSYSNSASFYLCNTITPEKLRELANELEKVRNSIKK